MDSQSCNYTAVRIIHPFARLCKGGAPRPLHALCLGRWGNRLLRSRQQLAIASYPDGKGYYVVTAKGYLFNYGDAINYGDEHKANLTKPIFGISVYP